ncbi:MAG TPA: dethiobiotin synthase [Candidatus Baltobacteraceae bacterium]|jgi:dethiobiotin synthase
MQRYLVTGTDTDIGKTRITASLAKALLDAGQPPTIVKLVQTGLRPGEPGDASRAGRLTGCRYVELARFTKAADPWSAALAEGMPTVRAEDLRNALNDMARAVVAEGAGGLAVPLNRTQNFGTVAFLARLRVVLAIGLRLGCMNHALLTLALCEQLGLELAGAVLVDRFEVSEQSYVDDVRRALQGKIEILGILPFEPDESASVAAGARLFAPLL